MKLSNIFGVHYSGILEDEYNSEKYKGRDDNSEVRDVDVNVLSFGDLDNEEKCLLLAFRLMSEPSRKEIMETALSKMKK